MDGSSDHPVAVSTIEMNRLDHGSEDKKGLFQIYNLLGTNMEGQDRQFNIFDQAESENESSIGEEDEDRFSASINRDGEEEQKEEKKEEEKKKRNVRKPLYFSQESVRFQESLRTNNPTQSKIIVRDINIDPKATTIAVSSL